MKTLIVGAGALGGYFGGRLLAAGRDVAFLVRRGRAEQLSATNGLIIKSPNGDLALPNPLLVRADAVGGPYDLVLVACKSTGLDGCIRDMAPAIGPGTKIIPMLNGMRHMETLEKAFGRDRLLGGRCFIFATLDPEGRVLHQSPLATFDFGLPDGGTTPEAETIHAELDHAGFTATLNPDIMQGMWEKWVLIACVAGSTCLMRAAIGDIVNAGGTAFQTALLGEAAFVAAANGHPLSPEFMDKMRTMLADASSVQSSSMHKDMEKGLPVEAEQIIGDLIARAGNAAGGKIPLLELIYLHLKAYETRRARGGLA